MSTSNWIAVFLRQDVWAENHDALVDQRDTVEIDANLQRLRAVIQRAARDAQRHEDLLAARGGVAR